ncbi:hypothetical protein [Oceanidesulfovibrio marinus]|uniref:Rho termination factor, N-terminal domain n=1 Tax=Oceanidesulfovibrio marinus TaxID=370038 RepID=A0A6P1ZL29_9BACT|nr:hypothetical protein [Oceanidesulfovibrio marinus]TVM34615.1 hypothetical protein DQK91_08570 [Oceanidesulfovibrio marinus]
MHKSPKTVAIRTPTGRRAVIPATDFNPAAHVLWQDDAPDMEVEAPSLGTMRLAELRDMARALRIPGRGGWRTKSDLRAGIAAHLKNKEG